jgi:hypothetical protein
MCVESFGVRWSRAIAWLSASSHKGGACVQVDAAVDSRGEQAWGPHEQVLLPLWQSQHEGDRPLHAACNLSLQVSKSDGALCVELELQ